MKKSIQPILAILSICIGVITFLACYSKFQQAGAYELSYWLAIERWLKVVWLVSFISVMGGAYWLKRIADSDRPVQRQMPQENQDSVDDECLFQDQSSQGQ